MLPELNHRLRVRIELLELSTNNVDGIKTHPLVQDRAVDAAEVDSKVHIFTKLPIGNRQRRILGIEPALHIFADQERSTTGAMIGARAVVLDASTELSKHKNVHFLGGIMVAEILHEIFDEETEVDNQIDVIVPASVKSNETPKEQFLGHYSNRGMSKEDRAEWIQHLKEIRLAAESEANVNIADGEGGDGSGWSDQTAGTGLLAEAGYTVRKGGPFAEDRQAIAAYLKRAGTGAH